jgi:hypothetical protein
LDALLHDCNASVVPFTEQQIPIYVGRGVFLFLPTGNGAGFKTTEFFKAGSRSASMPAAFSMGDVTNSYPASNV